MSKANALAGLIGSYADSGDESDEGGRPIVRKAHVMTSASESATFQNAASAQGISTGATATIHPAPIPHCPWSACYDETSGFTYYWNQQTNAVTWEAPPEYLLALKLARQQLNAAGSTEVSAEEWQLYQQALAEKQNTKAISKPAVKKQTKPNPTKEVQRNNRSDKKRSYSDDEDEKIELITSYHNSDSESDHEPESPVKKVSIAPVPQPATIVKTSKHLHKKAKTKPVEYGPMLPPNQNYSIPIGPEIPPELLISEPKTPEAKVENGVNKETKIETEENPTKIETEDSQDESTLLKKLKDKAKLLEKLGGELPSGLEKIIQDNISGTASPTISEDKKSLDIDDLLDEIEKKELPKVSKSRKIDMFDEDSRSSIDSLRNSPKSGILTPKSGTNTPVDVKALFPSSKNIDATSNTIPSVVENVLPCTSSLFPSAANIEETEKDIKADQPPLPPETKANVYLSDPNEPIEKPRKKLRISNSVLPERKKAEPVSYTTKYSQHIEGFSTERVGLGFSNDGSESPKKSNAISYGKGLMFTKGETLNEEKKDDDLDDLTELVEAKLKYLNQVQPGIVAPVQEMLIQMQTLVSAFRFGALSSAYWRRWADSAAAALAQHERLAAPAGWAAVFHRSEGRYQYVRDADGFEQWEYPAIANTDMDISTTPPHPGLEAKDEAPPPPLPPSTPPPPPPPPVAPPPPPRISAPPPAGRITTPPPPEWDDPPPPGCDDLPPLPTGPKQEIGDELLSFYNDIAELEKHTTSAPPTAASSPEPPPLPPLPPPEPPRKQEKEKDRERDREREKEREREKGDKEKHSKKKSKVKISTSMGMKHKTVSNMVAKWQQVADEINSD